MDFSNFWIIVIFIIIIILLLMKLFDIKIEFYQETDEVANDELKDEIEKTDFFPTQDGTIKTTSEMLKDKVEIKHSQASDDYSNTEKEEEKRSEEKTELNQEETIVPKNEVGMKYINANDVKEEREKVYYPETKETVGLVEGQDNKELDEICRSKFRKYETEQIDKSITQRFAKQNKEYEKAFKGKNELDYQGNVITDENIYQFEDFNYINANQLYIPTDYKTTEEDYGRNYIPPELWYKNNRRLNLPVCVPANGRCTIKDSLTSGYPLDVIEWHESRKVMNPDGINIDYVKQKLNTNGDIGVIEEVKNESEEKNE